MGSRTATSTLTVPYQRLTDRHSQRPNRIVDSAPDDEITARSLDANRPSRGEIDTPTDAVSSFRSFIEFRRRGPDFE